MTEMDVTQGGNDSFTHEGLTNGTVYTYSVFVIDAVGNASAPETVEGTPRLDPPGTVQNVVRTDVIF